MLFFYSKRGPFHTDQAAFVLRERQACIYRDENIRRRQLYYKPCARRPRFVSIGWCIHDCIILASSRRVTDCRCIASCTSYIRVSIDLSCRNLRRFYVVVASYVQGFVCVGGEGCSCFIYLKERGCLLVLLVLWPVAHHWFYRGFFKPKGWRVPLFFVQGGPNT